MKCREYIFKLTSGQLEEADLLVRLKATQHRLSCRNCRAFTRNDKRLDDMLMGYEAHLSKPDASDVINDGGDR
jgi:hypothetical protein